MSLQLPGIDSALQAAPEGRPVIDTLAEFLLFLAIRHEALSPMEAQKLALWDLTTIAEFLALRLQSEGLLTPDQCESVLGHAEENTH